MAFVARLRAALFIVVALLVATAAHASLFQIDVTISFDPPAGSPFADGSLSGSVQFYIQPNDENTKILSPWGTPVTFSDLVSGDVFNLEVPDRPPLEGRAPLPDFALHLSFNGTVATAPTSIFPAFAFESLVNPPGVPPTTPPVVLVGNLISATPASLYASGPLFAFASPGTAVGTWQVDVTAVPEPASLLLLSSGLISVWLLRRRS